MAALPDQNPCMTQSWARLSQHARQLDDIRLAELLDQADRFDRFSLKVDGLVGDFSRSLTTPPILDELIELAKQVALPEKIQSLMGGAMVNGTERRAALHTALRSTGPVDASPLTGNRSPSEDVASELDSFLAFADSVRDGSRAGSGNRAFRHVINIGIGGSDLGPRLVADALATASDPVIVRFVAGIDGIELQRALRRSRTIDNPVYRLLENIHYARDYAQCGSGQALATASNAGRKCSCTLCSSVS